MFNAYWENGTLYVHGPNGRKALDWQTEGWTLDIADEFCGYLNSRADA